jgi:methylmalonyl-CoA mutase cobalamin-binding subunit
MLLESGVARVFHPGATMAEISSTVLELTQKRRRHEQAR